MSAESVYFKAIEVTAGATLTNHVVANEKVALFYLEQINRRNMRGQITFFALNRVRAPTQRPLTTRVSCHFDHLILTFLLQNGEYLVKFVKHDEQFNLLFRSIIGNTILVKDIPTGRQVSNQEGFNSVTFDGDEINVKGPMSGGYIDSHKSKLEAIKGIMSLDNIIQGIRQEVTDKARECVELEKLLTDARSKLSVNEQERVELQRSHELINKEKRELFELNNRLSINMEDKV